MSLRRESAIVTEFGLIKSLAAVFRAGPRTLTGIGDDAAVLAAPDGRVVATTDFLLEGRHFLLKWARPGDIGHKAAARSLADVAAMGAVPTGVLVALAVPAGLDQRWLRELADGLAAECARAGADVIGGDTARADQVVLAVTCLGDLAGRAPVLRSGARPGDVVAVAGPLGHAAAGLALLSLELPPGAVLPADLAPLVAAQLRPSPPYQAGPEAAALGATAMIDVSDGLLADLGHIAEASDVVIDVRGEALRDPLLRSAFNVITSSPSPQGARIRDVESSSGGAGVLRPEPPSGVSHPEVWALTGGEDHSLAATFPAGISLPPQWRPVGRVLAPPPPVPASGAEPRSSAAPSGAEPRSSAAPSGAEPRSSAAPSGAMPDAPASAERLLVDGRPWPGTLGWDHFR